ncbi:hypothetical protein AWENTII_009514 [Aspergillus wentii]
MRSMKWTWKCGRPTQYSNEKLVLEIAGHDTQGVGKFSHEHPEDRDPKIFDGLNTVDVGQEACWPLLSVILVR